MTGPIPFPAISPEIFAIDVFGFNLALRWYAMGYIVGIAIGYQMVAAAIRRPKIWLGDVPPLQHRHLEDLLVYIVVGVIAGGRLGYVLFYNPSRFIANPIEIPMIWTGGMSFHGGFLGVVIGVYLFSYRNKIPFSALADVICLAATPAIFLVRIANFINAELWGRPTDLPWAVAFPGEAAQACATAATRDPFGQAGDFITAPEISQMFGELIGLCLAQAWMDQGQPVAFTLAELGPGRGTLMADVLRATRAVPGFHIWWGWQTAGLRWVCRSLPRLTRWNTGCAIPNPVMWLSCVPPLRGSPPSWVPRLPPTVALL